MQTHTPIGKHVKTLIHAQLGDVKHQATSEPRTSLPRCFYLGWAGGMSEASSGSGSPQSSTGPSNRRSRKNHVVTSARASPLKNSAQSPERNVGTVHFCKQQIRSICNFHTNHQHFYNMYPIVFRARVCELTPWHCFNRNIFNNHQNFFLLYLWQQNLIFYTIHWNFFPVMFVQQYWIFSLRRLVIFQPRLTDKTQIFQWHVGIFLSVFFATKPDIFSWDVRSFSSWIWGKKVKHWNIFQPRLLLQHQIYSTNCQKKDLHRSLIMLFLCLKNLKKC